jgi:ABC-type sugar transport system ATPase subunit
MGFPLAGKDVGRDVGLLHLPYDPVGSVPAHVSLVEPLGAEAILHVTIAGSEALSRTTSDRLPGDGEAVTLSVRLDQIKLFDTETGRAI